MKSEYRSTSWIASSVGGRPDWRRCWKAGKVWSAPWLFIKLGWNIYGPALQPIEDAGFDNSHRRD
jgi:hypothetical protein